MAPAWQVRSLQRQKLIEKLMTQFNEKSGTLADNAALIGAGNVLEQVSHAQSAFAQLLLIQIVADQKVHLRSGYDFTSGPAAWEFWQHIKAEIKKFSRAPEEQDTMEFRFFLKVVESESRKSENDLMRLEHADPRKILHASSSMEEIEIPRDEDD